jgi:hypothetical protein
MPRRRLRTRQPSDFAGELRGDAGHVSYAPRRGQGIAHRVKTRTAAVQLERRGQISPENLAAFLTLLPEGSE